MKTADEVVKLATEKFAAERHDAFVLGAFDTFKKAGATDALAELLTKLALQRSSK